MKLVAKINHYNNGENIITSYDFKFEYNRFKTHDTTCECCHINRYRNITYILEDNGKYIQVGSSCLNKVLGIEPTFTERMIRDSESLVFDGFQISSNVGTFYNLEKLVSYMLANPTENIKGLKYTDIRSVEVNEKAKEIIDTVSNMETSNDFSDKVKYLANLSKSQEYFLSKDTFNMMKYLVKIYNDIKAKELIKDEEGLTSNVFVIKSLEFKTTDISIITNRLATKMYIYRAIDENNNLIDIRSSKELGLDLIGKTVKCTILGQYISRIGKITKVNRLKVI